MRVAEGPGPRAVEAARIDVAGIDDLQGREQFAAEIVAPAAAVAGDGGERLHQRAAADILAEIRLDAPHAGDDVAVDAVAALRRRERLGMLTHGGAPVRDALLVDEGGHVVPDRRLELGLVVHQLEHAHVGLHARKGAIEGGGRDALGGRLPAQAGEAGAEVGLRDGGGREQRGKSES